MAARALIAWAAFVTVIAHGRTALPLFARCFNGRLCLRSKSQPETNQISTWDRSSRSGFMSHSGFPYPPIHYKIL